MRGDIVLTHPIEQLAWNLHQGLFRQHMRIVLEVVEGDELNDISGHVLAEGARVERLIVAIERLHRLEVGVTHTNDDDGQGVLGATHNLVNGLVHVADYAISNDDQDVELLIHLGDLVRFDIAIDLINDIGEVSRAVQLAAIESTLIALYDLLDTIDTWVEDVAVEGEAV